MSDRAPVPPVAIVVDASCDLPAAERVDGRWTMLADTYRGPAGDIVDLGEHSRELTRMAVRSPRLQVRAPTIDDFLAAFERLADHERVFSIHGSSAISEAADHARTAAASYPNVVVVELTSSGLAAGLVARLAMTRVIAGQDPQEVASWLAQVAPSVGFAVIPDRIDIAGRQRLTAAQLLSGRPFISTGPGGIVRGRRLRSRRRTLEAIERHFRQNTPAEGRVHLAVGHGDAAGAVDPLLDVLERVRPQLEVELVGRIGPRIVRHVRSRCIGMAWVSEPS